MSTYITAVQITDVQAQALKATGIVRTIVDLISGKHYIAFRIQLHGHILTECNWYYVVFNGYTRHAGACVAVGIGYQ